MGDFYSHDWMDDEDWADTSEEREARVAKDKARKAADELQKRQAAMTTVKHWINQRLDKMSFEDIEFMYKISVQVPEMRAFFKVFKELQNNTED